MPSKNSSTRKQYVRNKTERSLAVVYCSIVEVLPNQNDKVSIYYIYIYIIQSYCHRCG